MEEKVPKYIISVHQVVIQAYSIYRTKILDGRQTCMRTMEFLDNGATCNTSVREKSGSYRNVVCTLCGICVFKTRGKSHFTTSDVLQAYTCTRITCGFNYVTHSRVPNDYNNYCVHVWML
jgi:hypothetical protein